MSVLVNTNTKVIVQGITGRDGSFHSKQMIDYGTQIVASFVNTFLRSLVHELEVLEARG